MLRVFVTKKHKHFWSFGCNTLYIFCIVFVYMIYVFCMYIVYTNVVDVT